MSGAPFVVKNDQGRVVLAEWGALVAGARRSTRSATASRAASRLDQKVISQRGNWPTSEPDFDFCDLVQKVLG